MEGLAALEKRAFVGRALKMFNPFSQRVPIGKIPSRMGTGIAFTLPFGTGSSSIKNFKKNKYVW